MRTIASDLSYEVSQRRRRLGEFRLPVFHLNPQALQLIGQRPVIREAIAADRVVGVSEIEWAERQRQMRLA